MPIDMLKAVTAAANAVTSVTPAAGGAAKTLKAGNPGSSFADTLGKLVKSVEKTTDDANVASTNMLDKTGDVHEAMIALQRAEMTFQLTVQIRNKLMTAYNDIMRMPI
jgi:flagellar hook-basal body complex protein FliE